MFELDIPICPECGRLAEDVGEGEIYCEECLTKFFKWLREAMGGKEGLAELNTQIKRDLQLGIGLDRQPDDE